ncbi:MAG: Smr/MutS family protein [Acidobacteria bacterium]|nr:Smr/MutS family protein [Acidobacteriota bacterium]
MKVSRSTLEALEFPALLRLLVELAVTDVGAAAVRGLVPAGDLSELDERRERYEEARLLLVDAPLVGALVGGLEPLLERLADPRATLDSADVLQAAELLTLAQSTARRVLEAEDPACPRLSVLWAQLPDSREWTRRVRRVLDARGRIRDDASPALTKLRRQVRAVRDGLYRDLQQSVRRFGDQLSEETIPLHEGRLVLLLKSGARGQLDGLVHGRSGSGRSFYFEPLYAVEANNRLRTTIDDEEAERARLLGELLDGLRELAPAVGQAAGLVAGLDLLQAAARFAELAGARLADLAEGGNLRLCGARHPLLDPALADLRQRALGSAGHRDAIVALDLELDAEARLLVITGPNAGGKTVALKTAGLLVLAAQCGLPVPCAKGTRLPLLRRMVASVGDEQDLLHEHSTFSARLLRLREAWEAAGANALVLLDELGSGTDPDEGAALAAPLLEHLRRHRTLTIVTTHLTRLAAQALESEGALCAAMEFDGASDRPTYRLLPGTPGASEALALARRLGLPAEWLERAIAELDPQQRRLQELLEEVERTRKELTAGLERVEREEQSLARARAEAETERGALTVERRKVARGLKARLDDFERRVRERLGAAEAAIRAELEGGRRPGVAARAAQSLLAEPPPEITEALEEKPPAGPLEIGAAVRHRRLGWEGRLVKLERGRAEVNVRGKRVQCREDELVGLTAAPVLAERRIDQPAAPAVAAEIKLLGRRVEEALIELDHYLDQALLANREEVRVVHGHGTGRLREAVREHLRRHPVVADHRPGGDGEGGDGATVVTLKG